MEGGDGAGDGGGGVFCYVNSVFAPGLDEGVGGLWRVSLRGFCSFLVFGLRGGRGGGRGGRGGRRGRGGKGRGKGRGGGERGRGKGV